MDYNDQVANYKLQTNNNSQNPNTNPNNPINPINPSSENNPVNPTNPTNPSSENNPTNPNNPQSLNQINSHLTSLLSGDKENMNIYKFGLTLNKELKEQITNIEGINDYLKGNGGEYMIRITSIDDEEGDINHKDIKRPIDVNIFGEARLIHHNELCNSSNPLEPCTEENLEKNIIRSGMYNFYISNRLVLYKVHKGVSLKRAQGTTMEVEDETTGTITTQTVNLIKGKLDFDYAYFGDLNGDGNINLQDVLLVPEFFENRIEDLDVNMDGKVDLWDLYKLPLNERKTMDGEYTGDQR